MGFMDAIIGALVYNISAKWVWGIDVEFVDSRPLPAYALHALSGENGPRRRLARRGIAWIL